MFNFYFFFFISMIVGAVIFFLNFFVMKNFSKNDMIFSIESGFLSYKSSVFLFNLSFFIILLLFVLFDIELIFVLFFPFMKSQFFFEIFFVSGFIFLTLWFEWLFGKMMWY